ncbi:MAG: UDP-N-acetylmuramoyl-tripeptide--D-alanyl-D-alanine ligase [Bacteroidota bacterium]
MDTLQPPTKTIESLHAIFSKGATICTDTRKVTAGCIFFALKGERFDGNLFVEKALEAGAVAAVADAPSLSSNANVFVVPDALTCLQQLALHHRKSMKIPFVAITGSNGKTTTKELVGRVLAKKYRTVYTQGNLNNHIGVPLTLLSVRDEHQIAIIEMGANHRHEIAFLCSLALPTHVLITNVGLAHLEGFGGFEGVKLGKGEMYTYAKGNDSLVFLNHDNQHLQSMLGSCDRVFTYGTAPTCEVIGVPEIDSKYASLQWKTPSMESWRRLNTNIAGSYNFENIMAAIAVGTHFGVDINDIDDAITSYIPDNQRSQEIKFGSNLVILDAYNANPTSMEAAIKNFHANIPGDKMIFLGEMLELGTSAESEHKRILGLALETEAQFIIAVGKNFSNLSEQFNDSRIIYLNDSSAAADWLKSKTLKNQSILIKGSRGSKMELVLDAFK